MEIAPGIFRLQAGYANVYLCVEDEGLTLVDSGVPRRAAQIMEAIRALGQEPGKLRYVIITHADFDHAGSAADLHRMTGAAVVASRATGVYLRRGRSSPHIRFPLGILGNFFNRYGAVPGEALALVDSGNEAPVLGGLRAVATPGHTPDHHAFYSPSRGVLFCGDALGVSDGELSIPPAFIASDPEAARASARALLALAPTVYACGHGDPLVRPAEGALEALRQKLAA